MPAVEPWLAALLAQIPLVVGFFIALQRGYLYTGRNHNEILAAQQTASQSELAARDREIDFREKLRQEGLVAYAGMETRLESLADVVKESTDVSSRSIDLTERLLADRPPPGWDPNVATHPIPTRRRPPRGSSTVGR